MTAGVSEGLCGFQGNAGPINVRDLSILGLWDLEPIPAAPEGQLCICWEKGCGDQAGCPGLPVLAVHAALLLSGGFPSGDHSWENCSRASCRAYGGWDAFSGFLCWSRHNCGQKNIGWMMNIYFSILFSCQTVSTRKLAKPSTLQRPRISGF